MNIKPIRSKSDLAEAKARLADLMAENHAGSADEIEIVSALIERFERHLARIETTTAIEAIKYRMTEMGLSPRHLEPYIGSRARVSEVLSGKRQLSLDMIRSLHEGLGIPYESLIAQRATNKGVDQLSEPAIERLSSLGLSIDREEWPPFLNSLFGNDAPVALLKKTRTQRAASKTDQGALLLWQAAVLRLSDLSKDVPYKKLLPSDLRSIGKLSSKSEGPKRAIQTLRERGVSVVILPALPGTYLDGAVMLDASERPVIGLTLRHDRVDGFWFTLMHELSHATLHYSELRKARSAFIDDMEINSQDKQEIEADLLARNSLIPESILLNAHWADDTSLDTIISVAAQARVHVSVVAGRWQRDHNNYKKFSRLIERDTIRPLFPNAG